MVTVSGRRSAITVYSSTTDPYSHQVRIVLAEKGVTADIINVNPDNKPEELLDLNPYNEAPTLEDRDLSLFEARIIMEYLDERFPHPPLMPVYPVARAKSRLMMHRIDFDWYRYVKQIMTESDDIADRARTQLKNSLLTVAPVFTQQPFFLSDEFTLVDCCLAPLLWRLPHFGIQLTEPEAAPINAYASRLFERDAFKASLSDAEKDMRK